MLWSLGHPKSVLFILLGMTVFFSCFISTVTKEMSARMLWSKDDPAKILYEETVETFGSNRITVVFVKDKQLFTLDKLQRLDALHRAFARLPRVERVESLFSMANLQGKEDVLYTSPFISSIPKTQEEADRIKADALRNPLAVKNLVSDDGSVMAFNLFLDASSTPTPPVRSGKDKTFSTGVDEAMDEVAPYVEEIFQFGPPYIARMLRKAQTRDQRRVIPLAFLLFSLISVLIWRSFSLVGFILITSGLSVLWTLGFMGLFQLPLNAFTVIIPALLIALGSTEDTHIFAKYLTGLQETGSRHKAILFMIEQSSLPLVLTALTTFLGFLAIALNEIVLLRQFGMICAFGLFANPLITFLTAPVYLRYFGPKQVGEASGPVSRRVNALFNSLSHIILLLIRFYRRQTLIAVSAGVVLLGIFAYRITVDIDFIRFFKPSSPVRQFDRLLHENLAGRQSFIIHISGSSENVSNTFYQPENLSRIVRIQQSLRQSGWCDLTISIVDYLLLINREMHNGDEAYYSIPDSAKLISQYFLIMPEDEIASFITNDANEVNISVRHSVNSSHELEDIIEKISFLVGDHLTGDFSYRITGESVLTMKSGHTLVTGLVLSLTFTLVVVFVLLSLLFRSCTTGMLALIPNSLPIILLFGTMGLLRIPLEPGSAMVAAIAIGIAVDDTIHFLVCYHREMTRLQDQDKAVAVCIRHEIRPVVATSLGMISGFAAIMLSSLVPLIHFAFLSALVMLFSLMTDLLITPILLSSKHLPFAIKRTEA
ncbi:hypothetical protein KKHLCK_13855 [Candidatus Electrothrix laxa]